jgi:hypothetical protein
LQLLLEQPKNCRLDECMVYLVNQTCPALSKTLRAVPQSLAVVVVGSQVIGKLYSHGLEIPKLEQGWILLKALGKQAPNERDYWDVDGFQDKRKVINSVLLLAEGSARNHILTCLSHLVSITLLISCEFLFLDNYLTNWIVKLIYIFIFAYFVAPI